MEELNYGRVFTKDYGRVFTRVIYDGAKSLNKFNCNKADTTTDYNLGVLHLFNYYRNFALRFINAKIKETHFFADEKGNEILLPYINGVVSEVKRCASYRLSMPKPTIEMSKDKRIEWIISVIGGRYTYEFDPEKWDHDYGCHTIGEVIAEAETHINRAYRGANSDEKHIIEFEYCEFLKGLKEANCIPPDIMKLIGEFED